MSDKREPKNRGLGRGLSALLGDEVATAPDAAEAAQGPVRTLAIDLVAPNPAQPRRQFREEDLEELTASVRARGILQPLIVRPDPEAEGRYQIVAGERRWRAAQAARLHEVPVVVREYDDRDVLEIAIIENVQRADLTPVEEARGYARLMEQFGYTQESLARILGKSRSHLANTLRLLQLPEPVLRLVEAGSLTAGHARAMITAPDPVGLARECVAKGLTVRQVEARAKQTPEIRRGQDTARRLEREAKPQKDADTRVLEGDLSAAIGMAVQITHGGPDGSGEVRIRYRDLDDLDRLCRKLCE